MKDSLNPIAYLSNALRPSPLLILYLRTSDIYILSSWFMEPHLNLDSLA